MLLTTRNSTMNVDRFKQDHSAILAAVNELRSLTQSGIAENAASMANKIVTMSSSIKLHLAAEDNVVYPAMAKSANPVFSNMGKAYQSEMGKIAAAFLEFSRAWNFGPKIAAEPERFRAAANGIFKALHERIQRENTELYPAAEKV